MTNLEWDEEKRRANIEKHGLDFADAKYLEPRYWAFALLGHQLHRVAFCRRGVNLRIIIFRKANRKEIKRHGK